MKNLEKQQKCTMYNVQCTTNDERQERKENGNIDSVSVFGCFAPARWANIPRNNCIADARNDGRGGFTLVELVITIAIVIILSVISVPIYRGYVDKAKMSEGYALLGTIFSAQKAYYSEHGNFLRSVEGGMVTCCNEVLGIDARGNKYFTYFSSGLGDDLDPRIHLRCQVYKPQPVDIGDSGKSLITLRYNITSGSTIWETN